MTFEQAQEAIRGGALFGNVHGQLADSGEQVALADWFVREPGLPNLEARVAVAPTTTRAPAPMVPKITRQQAASAGYTGDMCSVCGGMRMTRNGSCLKCEECGSTTGCS